MIDRTGHYYHTVVKHREQLKKIWESYSTQMQKLEPHKGSIYYETQAAQAAKERDTAISALQTSTGKDLVEIIAGMRESAQNRPMEAPTSGQLALLQALKMRDSISRSELEQASRTLKDSPVCLSVLQELVEKNGYMGMRFAAESTESIEKHIDSLARAAQKIVKLTKPDSRREAAAKAFPSSPDFTPMATDTMMIDRDFSSEEEILAYCGNVDNVQAFRVAVNA